MGLGPVGLGVLMGGASAASTLLSGMTGYAQSQANAAAQKAHAENLRRQGEAQRQQGEMEVQARDRERAQLRRQYQELQSRNAVTLGAANVDASSGSALAQADGNASLYASDIGDNAYARLNQATSVLNQYRSTMAQANALDAQASASRRQSLFPTLLNTALAGAGGFMSGYSYGGKLGLGRKHGKP